MFKSVVAGLIFFGVLLGVAIGSQQSSVEKAKTNLKIAAAPRVVRIEGERVKPEEAMAFVRSKLIEEGPAVARMSELQENINTVRYNINTYRTGYSLMAEKVGERYVFVGPIKCWRAASTGDVSVWPPTTYLISREEAIRRAMMLEPIIQAEPIDEMDNLRVYYLPSFVGHDGRKYQISPTALAFFIHPKTGGRMTVIIRTGRTYGSVDKPLAATSQIYVEDTASYSAGPFGIGRAHVPSVFYSKKVTFDMEPFTEEDKFNQLMRLLLSAHEHEKPLPTEELKALYKEMLRYTGGEIR